MNTLHEELARQHCRTVTERASTESRLHRLRSIQHWQHRADAARRRALRSSRRAERRSRKAAAASRRASIARDALA
jgi:hypothetical protein